MEAIRVERFSIIPNFAMMVGAVEVQQYTRVGWKLQPFPIEAALRLRGYRWKERIETSHLINESIQRIVAWITVKFACRVRVMVQSKHPEYDPPGDGDDWPEDVQQLHASDGSVQQFAVKITVKRN